MTPVQRQTWMCVAVLVGGLCGGRALHAQEATPAPRTLRLGDVALIITREDGADHVVAKNATGDLVSDSWCQIDEGTYDEYAAFFTALQRAVRARDVAGVATLVRFPLRVNGPTRGTVATAAQLTSRYGEVFTPKVVAALADSNPGLVFCHEGAAMVASGAVWAGKEQGRVALDVVNP